MSRVSVVFMTHLPDYMNPKLYFKSGHRYLSEKI